MTASNAGVWMTFLLCAGGGLGLLIGSFLNVVAYRVPAGISIVSPPSACPGCGSEIKAYDNVPVLSWLALRGKCRSCREPISVRYPIVELITGALFVLVAVRLEPQLVTSSNGPALVGHVIELVAYLYLAAISVALAAIDLDVRRLPNQIVLPSYLVGAVLLAASGVLAGDLGALIRAAVGAAGLFALYLLLALVRPGGMGWGDVKLAGVLGMFLGFIGWGELAIGAFAGFALAGVFSIALMVARRAGRRTAIPFGPWMLGGAWVGIIAGAGIWSGYLSLITRA